MAGCRAHGGSCETLVSDDEEEVEVEVEEVLLLV